MTFPTDDVNALFTAQTLTGTITISKEDFVSEEISITIVVNMTEIFPGVPLFYFIMIIGAVAAIAGYAIISRAIRNARIPRFVKKLRNVQGAIKSRKDISDSDLYPPYEAALAKKLGDRWEMLGLSLEDILGIDNSKGKGTQPKGIEKKKDLGGKQ